MGKQGTVGSKPGDGDAYLGAAISSKSEISSNGGHPVRELALCGALAPDELDALATIGFEVRYTAKQPIFFEGDEAKSFFTVKNGVAAVSKSLADGRRQVTGFLYPADLCGLATDGRYANSVEAITNLTLYCFARRQSEGVLDRFPKLERRLLGQASNELAAAQEQIVLLGRKTATEKVASFLLMISEHHRRNGQSDNPVWLPMTRRDIGDYLGLTIETTSRMFTELQRLGAISKLPDARVDLQNRQMLQEIAEGE